MDSATAPMTRLTRTACLEMLRESRVGRLAITHEAMPVIVPVNYQLFDGRIIFRTASDGMLARACDRSVVAFEVDDLQPDGPGGASVLVVGQAEHLPNWAVRQLDGLDVISAMGPGRDRVVAVALTRVSGRVVGSRSPERIGAIHA